jgi:hypothetical protein
MASVRVLLGAIPQEGHMPDKCSPWSEEETPSLPRRSRLYGLEPVNVNSGAREGLLSYLARLAQEHMVSPRLLIKKVFVEVNPDISQIANNSFFVEYAGTINGLGTYARIFSKALNDLTGRLDAERLTLLAWSNVLPFNGEGTLVKRPRWCPFCFEAQSREVGKYYSPLIWSFELYRMCHVHNQPMVDRCVHCGRTQPFIASIPDIGHCSYCGRLLAKGLSNLSLPADAETLRSERQVEQLLEGIVRISDRASESATSMNFAASLQFLIDTHFGGNRTALCTAMEWDVWAVKAWLNEGKCPTLPKLLQLSMRFAIDPVLLCSGPAATWGVRMMNADVPPRLIQRRRRPLLSSSQLSDIERRLIEALKLPPSALSDICSELGLGYGALRYWHRQLCRDICRRCHSDKRAAAEFTSRFQEELVREIVESLVRRRIYPHRRCVDRFLRVHGLALARPGIFRIYEKLRGPTY